MNLYLQDGNKQKTATKLTNYKFSSLEVYEEIIYLYQRLLKILETVKVKIFYSWRSTNNWKTRIKIWTELFTEEEPFRETWEFKWMNNWFIWFRILDIKYNQNEISKYYTENQPSSWTTDNDDWTTHSLNSFTIYSFLSTIVISVEVIITEPTLNLYRSQTIFFTRPYLSFFISQQSFRNFSNDVDRESAIGKYTDLMKETDFFLFDMIVCKKFEMSSWINKFFCDFNFKFFEYFNFFLILIQNILLLSNTFVSSETEASDYSQSNKGSFYDMDLNNFIIVLIQIISIIIIWFIYFKYKYVTCFQKSWMLNNNKTFVFRQKSDKGEKRINKELVSFFQDDDYSNWKLIWKLHKETTLGMKVKVAIVDCILINREICVFLYTLLWAFLYLLTKASILLIIPTFFVCNISSNLFAIYDAIVKKWYSMSLVLWFTYWMTYIFMWIAYYFWYENFVFYDVVDNKSGNMIQESYCYSTWQCWLFNMNYGVRPQFGNGDIWRRISYRDDYKFYIIRWLFDTLFYVFIVLILRNLFLGIILGAFTEWRNKNYLKENDRNNICFICQMSKDQCLMKNIDFKSHIRNEHNLWNYVYFMIYLHLSDSNNWNQLQKGVWDKIGKKDFSWIPNISQENE